jgi:dienelactone hydrolase
MPLDQKTLKEASCRRNRRIGSAQETDPLHRVIYDIFGFFPQTIQGADILAHTDNDQPYQVFIPDFFDGKPADISWYPPDNDEKGAKLGEFFKTTAAPPKTLERIPKVIDELKKSKGVDSWGIVGFCWGGKIVNLSSFEGTLFKVAAAAHPAMVAGDDAKGIVIPYAMLPSMDEDKGEVEKWQQNIKAPNVVEWFPDQASPTGRSTILRNDTDLLTGTRLDGGSR